MNDSGKIFDYSGYWSGFVLADSLEERYPDGRTLSQTRTEPKWNPETGMVQAQVTYQLRLTKEVFNDTLIPNGIFDPPEPFTDLNGDSLWNDADEWNDRPPHGNSNGIWDGPQLGLKTLWDALGKRVGAGEDLGTRLLQGGPYRSMEEARAHLGEETFRTITPFAMLHGRIDPKTLRPVVGKKQTAGKTIHFQAELNVLWPLVPESRVPVSVNLAPQEVLEAVLRPLEARFLRRQCNFQHQPLKESDIHKIGRIEEAVMRESAAANLAQDIVRSREDQPFRSWRQWERFVDERTIDVAGTLAGLEGTYYNFLTKQTTQIDDQVREETPFLSEEEAALMNANVNPNSRLNKFNPNRVLDRLIDKSDLTAWTTEWAFDSSGWFDVSSLGEISGTDVGATGRSPLREKRASSRIDTVLSLWDTWRDTTQRDFASGFISDNSESETVPSHKGKSIQIYPEPETPQHGAADWDGSLLLATYRNASILDSQEETLLFYAPFEEGLSGVGGGDLNCYPETDSDPHPDWQGQPWHPGWDQPSGRPNENSIVDPVNPGSLYPDGVWSDWRNVPAYAMENHVEEEAGGIGFWMKFGGRWPDIETSYRSHTFCSFTPWYKNDNGFFPYRGIVAATIYEGSFLQISMGHGSAGGSTGWGTGVHDVLASLVGGFFHTVDTASPLPFPQKGEWNYVGTAWDRQGRDGWLFHNGSTSRSLSNVAQEGTVSFEQDDFHRGRFRLGEISLAEDNKEWTRHSFLKTPACATIDEFSIYGPQGVRIGIQEEEDETTDRASFHPEHFVRMEEIWQREYRNGRYYNREDAVYTSTPRGVAPGTRFLKMSWTTLVPEDPVVNHRILLDFFDGTKWLLDVNGDGKLSPEEEQRARERGLTDEGGAPLSQKSPHPTFGHPLPGGEGADPTTPPDDANTIPSDGQIRYRAYFKEDANWLTTPLLESSVLDDVTITYVPAGGPRTVEYRE